MPRAQEILLLLTILVVGALLRFFALAAQGLWFDELLSVAISRLPLVEVIASPASIDPPLYYILLHFWLGITRTDVGLRVLSVGLGIAAIIAIYILTRHWFDARTGLIAALLTALSQFQIYYSHEVRMYSLLVLLGAVSLWTYSRAQAAHTWRAWSAFIVAMTLALYAHNYAGLTLLALDFDALWRWRTRAGVLKPMVIANIVIGLLFLPWFILLLQKFSWLLPALWLTPPTLLHLVLTLHTFVFGYALNPLANVLGMIALVAALGFIALAAARARRDVARTRASLRLAILALGIPLLIVFAVSQWKPVYIDRLLLATAPAFYALLAWGIVASDYRAPVRVSLILIVPLMLISSIAYLTQPEHARPLTREAVRYVAQQRAPGEIVVHTSDSTFLGGYFYDASGTHILLYHPADQWLTPALMRELHVTFETDARAAIAGQSSFWLIVALDHIPDEQRAMQTELDRIATRAYEIEIGGIGVYRYVAR